MRHPLFSTVVFMLAAAPAVAQVAAPPILIMPASPRALALGDAFAAARGDDAVLFYDPAQLADSGMPRSSVSASVQDYIAGVRLSSIAAGRASSGGRFALGLRVLDYGSEAEVIPDPAFGGERGMPTGSEFGASEYAITAGYASRKGPWSLGFAVSAARQHIGGLDGGAWTADVAIGRSDRDGVAALVVQNLGGDLALGGSSAPLPRRIRVGGSQRLVDRAAFKMDFFMDVSLLRGEGLHFGDQLAGGVEGRWLVRGISLAARIGQLRSANTGSDGDVGSRPLAFGLGAASAHWRFEWAVQQLEGFGGTSHRIGVTWAR